MISALQKKAFSVFHVVEHIDDKIMQDFISCIRLIQFEGDQISLEKFAKQVNSGFPTVISQKTELKVWKTIQGLVREYRKAYENSSEYDYRLL